MLNEEKCTCPSYQMPPHILKCLIKLFTGKFCIYSSSKEKKSEKCSQKRMRFQVPILSLSRCYTHSGIVSICVYFYDCQAWTRFLNAFIQKSGWTKNNPLNNISFILCSGWCLSRRLQLITALIDLAQTGYVYFPLHL